MSKLLISVMILSMLPGVAFARGINLAEAGVALWVFVVIGAAVILMQLIPAAILFFSFIGSAVVGKKSDVRLDEKEHQLEEGCMCKVELR